tara:strand:+ start:1164 stop:1520 length:357 start_codon:yes stop_codon:yes gene_type:complete
MSRLNDATPEDWNRLRKRRPAEEKPSNISLEDYKPYIDMAMKEAHIDVVNSPKHYNSGGVECIEAIEASMEPEAFQGYLKGNTLKYIWRMSYKGKTLEDCKKAQWYLNKLISTLEDNT